MDECHEPALLEGLAAVEAALARIGDRAAVLAVGLAGAAKTLLITISAINSVIPEAVSNFFTNTGSSPTIALTKAWAPNQETIRRLIDS